MCEQDYRQYTCGCKKMEEYRQCSERLGTNVKCSPVTPVKLPDSQHMCTKHMVKPDKGRDALLGDGPIVTRQG
jgi:hypothetical protein